MEAYTPLIRKFSAIETLQQPYRLTYALEPSGGGCLLTLSRVGRAPCTDSLQLGLTPRSGYMVLRYLYENCVQPEIWRDVVADCCLRPLSCGGKGVIHGA